MGKIILPNPGEHAGLIHYKRDTSKERSEDSQKAGTYVLKMLWELETGGLPHEHVYEPALDGDWEHIVVPIPTARNYEEAILQAGFRQVCSYPGKKDIDWDFRNKLFLGQDLSRRNH